MDFISEKFCFVKDFYSFLAFFKRILTSVVWENFYKQILFTCTIKNFYKVLEKI